MRGFDARRRRLRALGGALPLLAVPTWARASIAGVDAGARFLERLAALEREHGGRLGVAALDVRSGRLLQQRGDERFLMCSTFKVPTVGLVLDRVAHRAESLARRVPIVAADLVPYAPVVERQVGRGMTMAQLCEAAITVSDNAAGNLLLRSFGGPAALTAFVRRLGDATTRLDRIEVDLNRPEPTGTWDTTSPAAMARLVAGLLFGHALPRAHRRRLQAWMAATSTGRTRLRAGLPAGWPVGDKTGTGPTTNNDVAWVRPAGGAPWILASYFSDSKLDDEGNNFVHSEVARAFAALAGPAS
jgi:beta-lactamase class A